VDPRLLVPNEANKHALGALVNHLERQGDRWWDPIVVRHGQLSVLAFSDGHAEKHNWQQKSTLEMTYVDYPDCIRWPVTDGTDDLEYMRRGYNPAR